MNKINTQRYYLFILCCILPLLVIGQNDKTDSLKRVFDHIELHDTVRVKVLHSLTWDYCEKDNQQFLKYAGKLLDFSQEIGAKKWEAKAYNTLGISYYLNDYGIDTIINTYQKGLLIAQKNKLYDIESSILNNTGIVYKKIGQTEKAIAAYKQGLTLSKKINDDLRIARNLHNIAILLKREGESERAKHYYLEALTFAQKAKDPNMIGYILGNLGIVYLGQNELDSALLFYQKSLSIKNQNNPALESITLANIGYIYNQKQQYDKAHKILSESYQNAKKLQNAHGLGLVLSFLSQNYFDTKDYPNAILHAQKGLKALGDNGEISIKIDCNNLLSKSYEKIGKHRTAFKHYKVYHTLSDSAYSIEKIKEINKLTIQYEVAQKENENQLLKNQTENDKRIIKNQAFAAIGLGLALLFAIGWGLFIYRANQRKKQLNQILETKVQERTTELRTANKNLQQANYELRTLNYIASHDIKEPIRNIGNYSGLIQRKLPNKLKQTLFPYFDTIKRSTTQLYTLIEDFAKYTTLSKGEKIELESVDLNQLAQNLYFSLESVIKSKNGQIIYQDLPVIQSNNSILFTALKNLIENGFKYNQSEVPQVKVSYQSIDNYHQIIVSDNGIGIDPQYHDQIFEMFKRLHNRGEYSGSGIGLAIVKLVVGKLDGRIELKSDIGEGSRFILRLPKIT